MAGDYSDAAPGPGSGRGREASAHEHVGVVALAMGGPARPEEVRPFLEALFADPDLIQAPLGPLRRPLAKLVAALRAPSARRRYGLVGGSPFVRETRAQVAALAETLAEDGLPVELALSYGQPDATHALRALGAKGVRRVLALPLYPQRSQATTGSAWRALTRACDALNGNARKGSQDRLVLEEIEPYPTLPGLIEPLAFEAGEAVRRAHAMGHSVAVLLTAHGVPERYLRRGDPYVTHVEQSATAFREAAGLQVPVRLGYQSRLGPVRWVGPQVEEVVRELVTSGANALVVVPLTFLCEHLETRFDLDLSLGSYAWKLGVVHYQRLHTPGTRPELIAGLADLVRAARAHL